MINMSQVQYPSDFVGLDGKLYPTVGEAFRNSVFIPKTPNDLMYFLNLINIVSTYELTISITSESEFRMTSQHQMVGEVLPFSGNISNTSFAGAHLRAYNIKCDRQDKGIFNAYISKGYENAPEFYMCNNCINGDSGLKLEYLDYGLPVSPGEIKVIVYVAKTRIDS